MSNYISFDHLPPVQQTFQCDPIGPHLLPNGTWLRTKYNSYARPRNPNRPPLVTFADVGIGMMLAPSRSFKAAARNQTVPLDDTEILAAGWHSWVARLDGASLEMMFLVDCPKFCSSKDAKGGPGCERLAQNSTTRSVGDWDEHFDFPFKIPDWLSEKGTRAPKVHFRCTWERYSRSFYGSAKNAQKGAILWNALLHIMPRKRFYLKLDADSLLLPHNLLSFLNAVAHKVGLDVPVYFGNHRFINTVSTWGYDIDHERLKLVLSGKARAARGHRVNMTSKYQSNVNLEHRVDPRGKIFIRETLGWQQLERQFLTQEQIDSSAHTTLNFAQGSAYGMSYLALQALIESNVMARVHQVGQNCQPVQCRRKELVDIEDSLMGLCMHLLQIKLLSCTCFTSDSRGSGGVLSIGDLYSQRVNSRFHRHKAVLHRYLCPAPITVHPFKTVKVYQRAWEDLRNTTPTNPVGAR